MEGVPNLKGRPFDVKARDAIVRGNVLGERGQGHARAEAERERRAKVIAAEGEFQAAQRLSDAASVLAVHPMALTLRYLQTLAQISGDRNSTTIFPVPIDLMKPFLEAASGAIAPPRTT